MNTFPFGSILTKVEQKDKLPKKVFVLGVYASAVHAKWIDSNNKLLVKALAVASEPYIFWKGDSANKIIEEIQVPKEVGRLEPADSMYNGPSGLILDTLFLKPLGLSRDEVWLSDIIPYTRINTAQRKALRLFYEPLIEKYNIPKCTIPDYKSREFNSVFRREEILKELEISGAKIIVLLGDLPIKHFLAHYVNDNRVTLAAFGKKVNEYGNLHKFTINNNEYQVLPLVHPRQAGQLGRADKDWYELHKQWTISTNIGMSFP
jgi:uracil-DNA glycosylase